MTKLFISHSSADNENTEVVAARLAKKRLLLLALVIVLVVAGLCAKRCLEIDACLDQGGRWNYAENVCEK